MKSIIKDLENVHSAVTNHYACSRDPWPTFKMMVSDKLLLTLSRLRGMTNDNLLEACIQARAALPDAWAAVQCNVPVEVVDLLNSAIAKAEPKGWSFVHGHEHELYWLSDWRSEVANMNTVLGYEDWVRHRLESEGGAQ